MNWFAWEEPFRRWQSKHDNGSQNVWCERTWQRAIIIVGGLSVTEANAQRDACVWLISEGSEVVVRWEDREQGVACLCCRFARSFTRHIPANSVRVESKMQATLTMTMTMMMIAQIVRDCREVVWCGQYVYKIYSSVDGSCEFTHVYHCILQPTLRHIRIDRGKRTKISKIGFCLAWHGMMLGCLHATCAPKPKWNTLTLAINFGTWEK